MLLCVCVCMPTRGLVCLHACTCMLRPGKGRLLFTQFPCPQAHRTAHPQPKGWEWLLPVVQATEAEADTSLPEAAIAVRAEPSLCPLASHDHLALERSPNLSSFSHITSQVPRLEMRGPWH